MVTTNAMTDLEAALDAKRTPEQKEALARLLKLSEQQGVKPLEWDEVRTKADFWPDDESIDDFIATIEHWRSERHREDLP